MYRGYSGNSVQLEAFQVCYIGWMTTNAVHIHYLINSYLLLKVEGGEVEVRRDSIIG